MVTQFLENVTHLYLIGVVIDFYVAYDVSLRVRQSGEISLNAILSLVYCGRVQPHQVVSQW